MFGLLLAQAEVSANDVQHSYGNLIFMAVFFLILLAVGIWWLQRGA